MSDLRQYCLRLAGSTFVGLSLFELGTNIPDLVLGKTGWSEFARQSLFWAAGTAAFVLVLYLFLKQGLAQVDIFEPASPSERRPHWWLVVPWFLLGLFNLFRYLQNFHSPFELAVRAGSALTGLLCLGGVMWFGFGKWFQDRVAERRASMAAQATFGGLAGRKWAE